MKSSSYNNTRWRKLRLLKLQEQPLCEYCLHKGKIKEATQVDHIIPFKDSDDLMYEYDNLLSTCARCHQEITITQQHLSFEGLSFDEARTFKISHIKREVSPSGYYI